MNTLIGKKDSNKIKTLVSWYNMIPNLIWSALNLAPISIFCYGKMDSGVFYTFLIISLLTTLLPNSFFNKIQLGKTTLIYRRIGVRFINQFTQNGDIINRLIRKKVPDYKVISSRTKSVDGLLKQTYMFEKFHFAAFLFFVFATVYALSKNYFQWALVLTLTNFIYNVYPGFLQQYLRIRLTTLKQINA